MENIIELTNRYILKSSVTSLPVDFCKLKELLSKHGFEVLSYNSGAEIIRKLGLCDYAKTHKAFTAVFDDIKLVMYRDTLSLSEKLFCLAHELGHIVLGHTPTGISGKSDDDTHSSTQECEADDFAYALLAPASVIKSCEFSGFEICRATLLSDAYVGKIMLDLQRYNFGLSDTLVAEKFSEYINKHNKAERRKSINLFFPHIE